MSQTSDTVVAELNYFVDTGEKPVNYAYPPPPGVPQQSGEYTHHTMSVQNGRAVLDQLSLDQQGFTLTGHNSKPLQIQALRGRIRHL